MVPFDRHLFMTDDYKLINAWNVIIIQLIIKSDGDEG